jgi:hypothetical protein
VAAWYLERERNNFDAETLCRKDQPLRGHFVILVDKSDRMTPHEVESLKARIRALKTAERFVRNAMVSIFIVNSDSLDMLTPSFRLCNPGTRQDVNPLIANPDFVQRYFDRKFAQPLDDALEKLAVPETSPTSPILESIKQVSELAEFKNVDGVRTLIIFSDMVQNTADYSQYGGSLALESLKRTSYFAKNKAALNGVSIEVYYLTRAQGPQSTKHREFWREYFALVGAQTPILMTVPKRVGSR